MSEVGGPLAEVREHSGLDGLHPFRLLGVVGYPVLRAVGVRDEERALAVVAAAGARRHRRRLLAFFLPRRARASSAPFAGVLTGPACLRLLQASMANFYASWPPRLRSRLALSV